MNDGISSSDIVFNSMHALPNKLLQEDGSITDIAGRPVIASSLSYASKKSLPNKFLNPDGSYSTLNEIIADAVDTDVFIVVNELPDRGDPQKIYLVPDGDGGFIEYHYTDDGWDPVGTVEIDLSNYPTKTEVTNALATTLNAAKQYTNDAIQTSITNVLENSY